MLPVGTGTIYEAKLKRFLCYPPHSTVYTQERKLEMAVGLVVPETRGVGGGTSDSVLKGCPSHWGRSQ